MIYSEEEMDDILIALLFASDEPLSVRKISAILGIGSPGSVTSSLERIQSRLEANIPSIALESIAGGYQLATRKEFSPFVAKLYAGKRRQRLTRAGLETLAIIAYKQPVTRSDVEQIRGVSCGGVISTLLERSLIKITGKAKMLGSPFLYGTTGEFLEYLGLNSIRDLPTMEELEQILADKESEGIDTDELSAGDAGSPAGAGAESAPPAPLDPEPRNKDATIDEEERHT